MKAADTFILVLKVGRVAIITRGRYAGKKVNFTLSITNARICNEGIWIVGYF